MRELCSAARLPRRSTATVARAGALRAARVVHCGRRGCSEADVFGTDRCPARSSPDARGLLACRDIQQHTSPARAHTVVTPRSQGPLALGISSLAGTAQIAAWHCTNRTHVRLPHAHPLTRSVWAAARRRAATARSLRDARARRRTQLRRCRRDDAAAARPRRGRRANLDWPRLGFDFQKTNGFVKHTWVNGKWDAGEWEPEPFLKLHVMRRRSTTARASTKGQSSSLQGWVRAAVEHPGERPPDAGGL